LRDLLRHSSLSFCHKVKQGRQLFPVKRVVRRDLGGALPVTARYGCDWLG